MSDDLSGELSDEDRRRRLAELEARIAAARREQEPGPRVDATVSQAQLAWRMVIELVTGLLIGFGMGYGLDRLFGTMPVFLVPFTLLGLAAGIRTMMRSAREVRKAQTAAGAGDEDEGEEDERD